MSEQEYVNQMVKTEKDKIGYEKFGMLWFIKRQISEGVTPWPNDPSSSFASFYPALRSNALLLKSPLFIGVLWILCEDNLPEDKHYFSPSLTTLLLAKLLAPMWNLEVFVFYEMKKARVGIGHFQPRLHFDFPCFCGLFNTIRQYLV